MIQKYKIYFFAGGEAGDNNFNVFTGSFMRLMSQILGDDFEFVNGVHFRLPVINVVWALNNAQQPVREPLNSRIVSSAVGQILGCDNSDNQVIITSSSTGSIVAAQTAVQLASMNSGRKYLKKPFHLALATSIISPESELFRKLIFFQDEGQIGKIIHAELQDAGDNTNGSAGVTRLEAYTNAFGVLLPALSKKYTGPSFLNSHPVKGHVHRIRSQTEQKAIDYIEVILVKHCLAGEIYMEKAKKVLAEEQKLGRHELQIRANG